METQKAKTSIFIDKYHPKTNGLCAISIRVTFDRKKRYYLTSYSLTLDDFEKIQGLRPRKNFKEMAQTLNELEKRASDIIKDLPFFTWAAFEKRYLTNRGIKGTIEAEFNQYIDKLKEEGRIGTAESYECAKISICKFFNNAKFIDITVNFLNKYEKWMLEAGRSPTTIGIYLRSLRKIFNNAISEGLISKELYPFGVKKYEIPTANNTKKSLSLKEIGMIYKYEAKLNTPIEFSRDMWLFMYLCNGINVKDLCLLKYENIKGDFLEFNRAKTVKTKRKVEPIRIPLNDDAKRIILRYGNPIEKGNYIFKVLKPGLTPVIERKLIKQFNKNINDQMKNIATDLGIDGKLTTYVARHSFSTILQRSGASTEYISNALGHSNVITTQNYLAGFEDDSKIEISKALTAFKLEEN